MGRSHNYVEKLINGHDLIINEYTFNCVTNYDKLINSLFFFHYVLIDMALYDLRFIVIIIIF